MKKGSIYSYRVSWLIIKKCKGNEKLKLNEDIFEKLPGIFTKVSKYNSQVTKWGSDFRTREEIIVELMRLYIDTFGVGFNTEEVKIVSIERLV